MLEVSKTQTDNRGINIIQERRAVHGVPRRRASGAGHEPAKGGCRGWAAADRVADQQADQPISILSRSGSSCGDELAIRERIGERESLGWTAT